MFGGHLPSGLPGSISWASKQVGVPTYNLALMAATQGGHMGHQAQFYLTMAHHQRMRHLALAAAGQHQPTA